MSMLSSGTLVVLAAVLPDLSCSLPSPYLNWLQKATHHELGSASYKCCVATVVKRLLTVVIVESL